MHSWLLVALVFLTRPAAAQGVPLDANDPFQARVAQAYQRVSSYAGMSPAIRYADVAQNKWCNGGAAALAGKFTQDHLDTVFICSGLQKWNLTDDQLFFVIAHEFGHLKLRHTIQVDAKIRKLKELWKTMGQKGDEKRWIAETMAPIRMKNEMAADEFASRLLDRAHIDRLVARQVLSRGADIEGPTPDLDTIIDLRSTAINHGRLVITVRPSSLPKPEDVFKGQ